MNANSQVIELLNHSEMFQDYERAFGETTGMPLALRPAETWKLPLHGKRRENRFCRILAEKSRTCAGCLRMQERLAQSAADRPRIMTCEFGMSELAVPVKLGTETVGYLQTGQVMSQPPSADGFAEAAGKARELGVELDNETARQAYLSTRVVSRKRLDSAAHLLACFADYVSIKSNQLAVRSAHEEPELVVKAKRYIREHLSEDIALGQVAEAVHCSLFHLCKVFHRAAGMTFTEFVSRTRVEQAKNLLLNPNLRVSEIAYEVGFQSLTHFNRVFRKLVGESPTEYRGHLPGAG